MQELKERILKEGKVLPGNIVKVDGFLNHRIDCKLMADIADEFAKLFDLSKVDLILTAEASGIALAAICAYRYGLPMVFAKKAKSDNIEGGLYQSEIYSYTYKKKVTQILSKEWLTSDNHVLILDDFMANGEAVRGLCELVEQAGAELVGVGIAIEKGFQGGGDRLRNMGVNYHALAGRHRKGRRKRHHLPRGLIGPAHSFFPACPSGAPGFCKFFRAVCWNCNGLVCLPLLY